MAKVFVQGGVLALAGIIALALSDVMGLNLGSIVFGLSLGGILGLISQGGPVGRTLAFLVGVVVAIVQYLIRVLFLNDSLMGNVALILLGLVIITVVCGLTSGKLPLWSALLGVALVTGAYETSFVDAPQNVQVELFTHTTMALVPAALGFLAMVFVGDTGDENAKQKAAPSLQKSEV